MESEVTNKNQTVTTAKLQMRTRERLKLMHSVSVIISHCFFLSFFQVIRCMNPNSHIVLCGQISLYNKDIPYPSPIPDDVQEQLQIKNITRDRFLVLNYMEKFASAKEQLEAWVREGKLKYRETIAKGLETTGYAFVSMMRGGNIGKQIVKVAQTM